TRLPANSSRSKRRRCSKELTCPGMLCCIWPRMHLVHHGCGLVIDGGYSTQYNRCCTQISPVSPSVPSQRCRGPGSRGLWEGYGVLSVSHSTAGPWLQGGPYGPTACPTEGARRSLLVF